VYQDKIYVPCTDDICIVAKFWLVIYIYNMDVALRLVEGI